MTISNQTSKNVYVGDTSTLVFAYTFRIFADEDLEVTIQDTSVDPQTEITLVLTSDYTVSGAGNPTGGNVTLVLGGQLAVAPIATDNITIRRALPITQPTDYVENDPFPAESHEDALDRGAMIDQQLQEQLDRSLKLPANITGVDVSLPVPEAGAPIGWNDTATGLTNNPDQTNLSQVDAAADPDYVGATGGDGVIRISGLLTYADGGNYVTIGITNAAIDHDQLTNFTQTEHFTMLDEDDLVSDSDTQAATQQSIKAYVDNAVSLMNEFVELTDTPADYTGHSQKVVRVNVGETGLEFVAILDEDDMVSDSPTAIASQQSIKAYVDTVAAAQNQFTELTDTPAAYAGESLKAVRVNVGETALEFVTLDYSIITAGDPATDVTAAELEELTDGSSTSLHTHAGLGTDEMVAIDALATPGYLGAAFNDGVLRTAAPLSYTDGGDFVTIGLDSTADFDSTGTWQFARVEIDADTSYIDRDGSNNMTFTDPVTGTKTLAELASGGGGASLVEIVSQALHGFAVGDWIRVNGSGTYTKAIADNSTNAESVGVVSAVADANNFTFQFGGKAAIFGGLTPGAAYFLSDTVAGTITATPTTTEGSIVKPVLIAETATEGFVFNMRGNAVTSGSTSFYYSFVDGDLVGGVLSIAHNLGHKFALVQVFDQNDDLIYPDNINLVDDNNLDVDLSSFSPITGTWRVVVLDHGNTSTQTKKTLTITSGSAEYAAGVVTFTHNLDDQFPLIQVYDNNNQIVQPDDITATSTTVATIDLTSFDPIPGTWNIVAKV